jgi:hypothetical protein
MKKTHTLAPSDFEEAFGDKLSYRVVDKIREYDLEYTELTDDERNYRIHLIEEAIADSELGKSGEHRAKDWEEGWSENLDDLDFGVDPIDALMPRYMSAKKGAVRDTARFNGRFIKPVTSNFEYAVLKILLEWVFEKYMSDTPAVYEFGSGTNHHLLQLREINPSAKLYGLDWAEASQKIIKKLVDKKLLDNVEGHRFDFFNPDESFKLDSEGVAYTVAALEQVGGEYKKFVDYLVRNKPKLCVHLEPVAELMDESKLIDRLAVKYMKERNYLSGFLSHLRDLEKEGRIEIYNAQRTNVGFLFMEGYSLVVWSSKRR